MIHVTVGLPGSGKTYWAKEYARLRKIPYIGLDDLKESIYGTAVIGPQRVNIIFNLLYQIIPEILKYEEDIVIDGTFLNALKRAEIETIANTRGCYILFHVFRTPLEACKKRNLTRDRVVPEKLLDNIAITANWPTGKNIENHDYTI